MLKKKDLIFSKTNSNFFIVSSPSGAGKTTVAKKLITLFKDSHLSISCTTRERRLGEKNGKDYFFLSKKDFIKYRNKKMFIEWAVVHNNLYGTLKNEVLKKKKITFFDVDWQGARVLKKKLNGNCFSIFLLPPSIQSLKQRLIKRHKNDPKLALERFKFAKKDIMHFSEYDYLVINDNLEKCVNHLYKKINEVIRDKKIKFKADLLAKKMLALK